MFTNSQIRKKRKFELVNRRLLMVKVKRLKLQKLRLKRHERNTCFAKMINQKKLQLLQNLKNKAPVRTLFNVFKFFKFSRTRVP